MGRPRTDFTNLSTSRVSENKKSGQEAAAGRGTRHGGRGCAVFDSNRGRDARVKSVHDAEEGQEVHRQEECGHVRAHGAARRRGRDGAAAELQGQHALRCEREDDPLDQVRRRAGVDAQGQQSPRPGRHGGGGRRRLRVQRRHDRDHVADERHEPVVQRDVGDGAERAGPAARAPEPRETQGAPRARIRPERGVRLHPASPAGGRGRRHHVRAHQEGSRQGNPRTRRRGGRAQAHRRRIRQERHRLRARLPQGGRREGRRRRASHQRRTIRHRAGASRVRGG